MKEILIDPLIVYGPGECNYCGGPLWVADSELTLMELNKEGIPINEHTECRCEAICSNCGKKIPVARWQGGYVKYPDSVLFFKTMELENEIAKRKATLKKRSNEENVLVYKD